MPLLFILSGIMGACGVALAAAAAHGAGNGNLQTASLFLLVHASAIIGIACGAASEKMPAWLTFFSGLVLAIGTILFAGDLALRALIQAKLFAMAAPIGGSVMIVGWAMLAICGVVGLVKNSRQ